METTTKNNLIEKTIKSYLKHFGLKIKNGFIYKNDIAIYTEDLNNEKEVLSFLLGISSVLDSLDFWDLKIKFGEKIKCDTCGDLINPNEYKKNKGLCNRCINHIQ